MRNIYILLILNLLFLQQPINSQEIASFTLQLDDSYINTPVCVALPNSENINLNDKDIVLYEIKDRQETIVASQLEWGTKPLLWFIPTKQTDSRTHLSYVIKLKDEEPKTIELKNNIPTDYSLTNNNLENKSEVINHRDDESLTIYKNNNPVLSYRFREMAPPEGADPLYKRSGFIHPLFSPGGEVLTNIQPSDHYHHYGVWGPWTLTHIDGREVDFWNLVKGQGTVEFVSFLSEASGDIYSGFKVLQNHIDFNNGTNHIALNEVLEVRVWNVDEYVWIIDYTTTINTPLTNGILFDDYRYGGGICIRATEKWQKDNSTILTSEGKNREEADGSRARWAIVEGETNVKEKRSGILFMSHPSNRQHPEPLRVWPEDANDGKGDIMFNITPIRYKPWKIEPKQDYTLKYRMVVFDGELSKESAEVYWTSFANSPKVN